MRDRITPTDVRRIYVKQYIPQLRTMGVDTDGYKLEKVPGCWTLSAAEGFAAPGVMSNSYIGATAREAYHNLVMITKALKFATTWSVNNYERVTR